MKLLAMYLPQYHEVEENSRWWGEGYTEWTAVKKATPLFKGHNQPRKPLNDNYYDLSDESAKTWRWQAELAKEYGVFGFCVYHYWFTGKQLLQRPLEILLEHPEIELNYCICWANDTWTKTWYGLEKEVLMLQEYGDEEDWKKHFNYLSRFFKDERYIKIDNKPVINIYRTFEIEKLKEMIECWSELAKDMGFDGVYIVSSNNQCQSETRENLIDAFYNSEPTYSLKHKMNLFEELEYLVPVWFKSKLNDIFKLELVERVIDARKISKISLRNESKCSKHIYKGIFPMWDNTPRRKHKGMVYKNSSPELFYEMLTTLKNQTDSDEFVYINAWNEWGEGCYLEPDETYGYEYLEMIKKALT